MKYIYPLPIFRSAFLILTVLCCATCETNIDISSSSHATVGPADLTTRVTASTVSGFVTDENENPVSSASVVIGTITTSTDQYGYFEVKNVSVVQNAATVTVSMQNYFKATKTFTAEQGKGKFLRIKLIPKTQAGTINASTGGAVTLSNGLIISIPANAVVNAATNGSYSGIVNVYARLISATDPDIDRIMPGNLMGLTSGNTLQLLTTFGMAAVELNGSAGELLQIAAGKKATLTIPIPTALQSSATSVITLWYFNESNGLWMEEGTAVRTGNTYVGEVSHFSFWNGSNPGTYVQFNCTLLNQNSQPIAWLRVKITVVTVLWNQRWGYTDFTGYVGGLVPANAQLKLEVFESALCSGPPLYSQVFTTNNANLSLGNIMINAPASIPNVNGTVTNCTGGPVDSGVVIFKSGYYYYYYPVKNGAYNFNVPICSTPATASLSIHDLVNNQASLPSSYILNAGNNTIPNIQVCGTMAPEFIYYTINGTPHYYQTPLLVFQHTQATISSIICDLLIGHDPPYIIPACRIAIPHPATLPIASTTLVEFTLFGGGQTSIPNPITVQITEYGNVGQYIAGNFTGIVRTVPANTLTNVTCSFRIKRAF